MSSSQPLKTLLTVKRAMEEAAAQDLAVETARCAAAEATQRRLDDATEAARHDLRTRRQKGGGQGDSDGDREGHGESIGRERVAEALERQRFWARLTDEIGARAGHARLHQDGALAAARAAASRALTAHRAARQAREVVERLCARADAAVRQTKGRREEVALDEQGQDAHARARGQNRGG